MFRDCSKPMNAVEIEEAVSELAAAPYDAAEFAFSIGSDKEDEDTECGTIYVLRSKSDHPEIAAHRELIHKIGVTGGDVAKRIAIAERDDEAVEVHRKSRSLGSCASMKPA